MLIANQVKFRVRTVNFNDLVSTSRGIAATTTTSPDLSSLVSAAVIRVTDAQNVSKNANDNNTSNKDVLQLLSKKPSDVVAVEELTVPMQIVGSMNDYGLGCASWW
jgi:hypothetical protein